MALTIWKVEPPCVGFERGGHLYRYNELARQEVASVGGSATAACIEYRGLKRGGVCGEKQFLKACAFIGVVLTGAYNIIIKPYQHKQRKYDTEKLRID